MGLYAGDVSQVRVHCRKLHCVSRLQSGPHMGMHLGVAPFAKANQIGFNVRAAARYRDNVVPMVSGAGLTSPTWPMQQIHTQASISKLAAQCRPDFIGLP